VGSATRVCDSEDWLAGEGEGRVRVRGGGEGRVRVRGGEDRGWGRERVYWALALC
jgi:hypothetical protein